jgi:hypothetical protein
MSTPHPVADETGEVTVPPAYLPTPLFKYSKLIVACLAVIASFVTTTQVDDSQLGLQVGTAISGILAAIGVWYSENTVNAPASKFIAGTLGALGVLVTALLVEADVRATLSTFFVALTGYVIVYLTPTALPASPLTVEPRTIDTTPGLVGA